MAWVLLPLLLPLRGERAQTLTARPGPQQSDAGRVFQSVSVFGIREEGVSTQVQTKTTHERRKHGDSQRDMSRVRFKKRKK